MGGTERHAATAQSPRDKKVLSSRSLVQQRKLVHLRNESSELTTLLISEGFSAVPVKYKCTSIQNLLPEMFWTILNYTTQRKS
jgi:hypothetical protein